MAVVPVKGKECTLTVGAVTATGWVQGLDTSGERSSETVATWGEDITYTSTRTNTGTLTFLFDPMSSALGPILEGAFEDQTPVTLSVAFGAATRVYTGWDVTSYADSAPAEGLVSCTSSLTGPPWVTTYDV